MDFVIERVQLFYQDFIILVLGVLFFKWFFRYIEKKHFNEPNTYTKQYLDTNLKKAFMLLTVPLVYLAAPLTEEFMFRFLLIFFFPTFDTTAKIVSIIVAVIFGFTHYSGNKVTKTERDAVNEQDLKKANELAFENLPKHVRIFRKLLHVFLATILGYIAAYYGIVSQSIWVSVGIHAIWNILATFLLPIVVLLLSVGIITFGVYVIRPLLRGALNVYFSVWSKFHGGRLHSYEVHYGAQPKWMRWLDLY